MTSTPTPEPAKITCPDCGGHPSEPKLRTEGGSLSCSFCNRTLTFNFMRDNEPEHRACACRASRNARCQTCGGDGEIDVRPAPSTPGEGAGRPLPEFQMVACADHMLTGHRWRCRACRREVERQFQECCEEMWRLQRTTPAPPASPADDVPDADAVAFQNGYRIGVRVGSEHHGPCRGLPPASPVPPTPTPCPYIVTGGEGTSYCSLAERSAMHAAAPPSTPADPRPTDPTGSEA